MGGVALTGLGKGTGPLKSGPLSWSASVVMDIVVNPDLKAYIDPLMPDGYAALERSLLTEGCRFLH